MIIDRKDEIVKKAAESNQLLWHGKTSVQFIQDYYSEDWHIKAGTLAYIKVGTVLSTIMVSDGRESVECRIIGDMAACKATVYIDAIAFSDGTLLLKGEKCDPFPCKELFSPPSDSALYTMKMYEEVNAKIVEDANAYDTKITLASVIIALTGIILIGVAFFCHLNSSTDSINPLSIILVIFGGVCFTMGLLLKFFYELFDCPAPENRRLEREKKNLEEELLQRDAENVKVYEKGAMIK